MLNNKANPPLDHIFCSVLIDLIDLGVLNTKIKLHSLIWINRIWIMMFAFKSLKARSTYPKTAHYLKPKYYLIILAFISNRY